MANERRKDGGLVLWARWGRAGVTRLLSESAKDVALILASHGGGKNKSWPTADTLARLTGHTKTTVYCALARLKSLGIIKSTGRARRRYHNTPGAFIYEFQEPPESMEPYADDISKREIPSECLISRFKRQNARVTKLDGVAATERQKSKQTTTEATTGSTSTSEVLELNNRNGNIRREREAYSRKLEVGSEVGVGAVDLNAEKKKLRNPEPFPSFSAGGRVLSAGKKKVAAAVDPVQEQLRADLRGYFVRMFANGKDYLFCLEKLHQSKWRDRFGAEMIAAVAKEFEPKPLDVPSIPH